MKNLGKITINGETFLVSSYSGVSLLLPSLQTGLYLKEQVPGLDMINNAELDIRRKGFLKELGFVEEGLSLDEVGRFLGIEYKNFCNIFGVPEIFTERRDDVYVFPANIKYTTGYITSKTFREGRTKINELCSVSYYNKGDIINLYKVTNKSLITKLNKDDMNLLRSNRMSLPIITKKDEQEAESLVDIFYGTDETNTTVAELVALMLDLKPYGRTIISTLISALTMLESEVKISIIKSSGVYYLQEHYGSELLSSTVIDDVLEKYQNKYILEATDEEIYNIAEEIILLVNQY